jgi:hypothetical protein
LLKHSGLDPAGIEFGAGRALAMALHQRHDALFSDLQPRKGGFGMASLRIRRLLWVVAAGLLVGCGGSGDQPDLGSVSGTVTMDDKPLPNVWVMFMPDTGRTALARTDENGEYEMMYLEGTPGANLGNHKVSITTYSEDEAQEMAFNTGKPVKEPIPARYNSKTTLTAEVKEGDNDIDFPLTSAP